MLFNFPETLEKIQASNSLKNIREDLLAQYKSMVFSDDRACPVFPFIFRNYTRNGKQYGRMQCRFCSSFMNWKQKQPQGPFYLTKYKIDHSHQKQRVDSVKLKVINYLQALSNPSEFTNLNSHLAEIFNISLQYAQKLTKSWYRSKRESLKKIADNLKEKGIFFYYCPNEFNHCPNEFNHCPNEFNYCPNEFYYPNEQKIPQMTLIITPGMKKAYKQCGFSIKLDFTFKVIRDKVEVVSQRPSMQNLLLGLISGINSFNRTVVFGIVIVAEKSHLNIRKSLQHFFNFMGEECEAIITDLNLELQMQRIINSMNENFFKQKVTHLLDQYHVINNLNFGKMQENLKKYKIVQKILKSATVPKFNFYCSLLQKELQENQRGEFEKLKHLARRCCMAIIETNGFIGPNIALSNSQSLNSLLKRKIKFSLPYLELIPRIIDICQNINRKARKSPDFFESKLQKLCNIEDIGIVCKMLPEMIFEIILTNLFSSRNVNIVDEQANRIVLSELGEKITIKRENENEIWKCECSYPSRSGLPCPHLMKIIKRIGPYLHEFWSISIS